MPKVIWFREDLRIYDNHALHHACWLNTEGAIAIYVLDQNSWKKHDIAALRINFTLQGLQDLKLNLAKLNIPLVILEAPAINAIPELLLAFMQSVSATELFYNNQYEINESRRDLAVKKLLEKQSCTVHSFDDQVILAPGTVKTGQDTFFTIYTPFKNRWQKVFLESDITLLAAPTEQKPLSISSSDFTHTSQQTPLWPAGEHAATQRLTEFLAEKLFLYDKQRDIPALDGTSKLSPYLAAGMISPRVCFLAAMKKNANHLASGNAGALTWMNELIWRDFYKHVLVTAPRVSMNKPFKMATDKLQWDYDEALLQAWQSGNTGYPIIDAAMRQLNTTGWMHNRLRMVVAMFLTKNLFLDWHEGERYFMQHLIDGDLAANNGGWQWSASTGTDAAPYFRIFNPIRQSERFDPEGEFIKKYCPELKGLDRKTIHDPYHRGGNMDPKIYPKPIIELNAKRDKVLKAFKTLS